MDKYKFAENTENISEKKRPIQVVTEVIQVGSVTTIESIENQISLAQAQVDALTDKLAEIKKQTEVS